MSLSENKPKSQLRLFDLTMIVISLVIGMGIFRTPINVAKVAVTPTLFFLAWFLGGLIALTGSLTYAEIGSRYPVTGGYYKIFSRCYHPSLAFAINCIILVSNAASVSAVALVGAEYIANVAFEVGDNTVAAKMWIAGGCILLFYGVNLLGLRMSATAQNVLMVFKIGLMLMMISVLFVAPNANLTAAALPLAPMHWTQVGQILGVCLVTVSFTYGGYQQSINFGAEVKNAYRIMPKAIAIGIGLVILFYMSMNFAYYRVIGFEQLKVSQSIGAIMASHLFGESGFQVVSWLFFFSVLGYVNVMLLANPRVMFAMSEEGTLPPAFRYTHPKTKVMTVSLTIFTIAAIFTLFYAKEFDKMLNYIVFLDSIGMATSAATIFILRYRKVMPEEQQIYKVPLYPIVPIFYIVAYIFIATSVFVKEPNAGWNGLFIFTGFFIIYWLMYWWKFGIKR